MGGLTIDKILIILVIALIVLGPERLPYYAKKLGELVRNVKRMADGAKDRLRDEMGPDFDDVDWKQLDPRQYDPRRIIRDALLEDEREAQADARKERAQAAAKARRERLAARSETGAGAAAAAGAVAGAAGATLGAAAGDGAPDALAEGAFEGAGLADAPETKPGSAAAGAIAFDDEAT